MAELQVTVTVDRASLEAAVKEVQKIKPEVEIKINQTAFGAQMQQAKNAISNLGTKAIKLSVDRSAMTDALRSIRSEFGTLSRTKIKVGFDKSHINRDIQALKSTLSKVAEQKIKISLEGDLDKVTDAVARVVEAQSRERVAIEQTKKAQIEADAEAARSIAKRADLEAETN